MEHDDLKLQAVSGAKWSGASIAYTTVVNLVTTAILARLLSPSDFGLLGMMTVVIGLVGFLADAGVSNAIIYHQDATTEELSSLYWLNFLVGAAIFILILLSRPLAVAFFKEPRLSTYLPWLATSFLIMPIGQQFGVLLRKDLRFRTLTKIDIISTSISSITAIAIALLGFGLWSLVFRAVVGSASGALALFVVGLRHKWLPKFYFSLRSIRKYIGFGLFQIGERLIRYVASNMDYLVIGRFLGAEALGFYALANGLISLPLSKVNPLFTRVAFPVFAKVQSDDTRLRNGYLKMLRYISTLSFPLMAGMLIVAPLFIPIVYGPKWLPSVPVVQILCLVGIYKSLTNPLGSLLLAKGRADIGLYWNMGALVVMCVGVLLGVRLGIVGVALGTLAAVCVLWPGTLFLLSYLVNMKATDYLKGVKIATLASLVMMVAVYFIGLMGNQINNTFCLVFQITIGAGFYIVLTWMMARPLCLELKEAILRRR